jgi:hypothetical protein
MTTKEKKKKSSNEVQDRPVSSDKRISQGDSDYRAKLVT